VHRVMRLLPLLPHGALPRFGAVRTDLVLTGIGYTAADRAPMPLRQAERHNLAEIYTQVLPAAGASTVTDLRVPRTGSGPSTEYTVNPIPVAAATPMNFCGTTVFDTPRSSGSFRTPRNSGTRMQPATRLSKSAHASPATPAAASKSSARPRTGASDEYKLALSNDRAAAADVIVAAGASRNQVTTRGGGSEFPDYDRSELRPDGPLDPVIANTKRSVRITVTSPQAGCSPTPAGHAAPFPSPRQATQGERLRFIDPSRSGPTALRGAFSASASVIRISPGCGSPGRQLVSSATDVTACGEKALPPTRTGSWCDWM